MMGHRITITHSGMVDTSSLDEEPSSASLSIDAEAMSLATAWREAIEQMPAAMIESLSIALHSLHEC